MHGTLWERVLDQLVLSWSKVLFQEGKTQPTDDQLGQVGLAWPTWRKLVLYSLSHCTPRTPECLLDMLAKLAGIMCTSLDNWESQTWLFQTWLFANFMRKCSFVAPANLQKCVGGFLLYKFWRIFPGIFLEDFSGYFFPQK